MNVQRISKSNVNKKWKGDKNCDDENNNAGSDWDGGDCCGSNNYGFCKECKCLDYTFVNVSKGDEWITITAIKGACGAKDYVLFLFLLFATQHAIETRTLTNVPHFSRALFNRIDKSSTVLI